MSLKTFALSYTTVAARAKAGDKNVGWSNHLIKQIMQDRSERVAPSVNLCHHDMRYVPNLFLLFDFFKPD